MKREPLTAREHILVGRRLQAMRVEVMELEMALHDAYGSPIAKGARAVERTLGKLRNALDARLSTEYPMSTQTIEGVPITRIYYGAASGSTDGRINNRPTARDRLRAEAAALDLPATSGEPTP